MGPGHAGTVQEPDWGASCGQMYSRFALGPPVVQPAVNRAAVAGLSRFSVMVPCLGGFSAQSFNLQAQTGPWAGGRSSEEGGAEERGNMNSALRASVTARSIVALMLLTPGCETCTTPTCLIKKI